jgi:NAD(P)-dependent dehydrogenase (short-subunit alcohol dehydrogenase family)
VGKGVALGLGEAGATVYITGRTVQEGQAAVPLPGTIHQTAEEVNALGGQGIAIACDHTDDEQVKSVLKRIACEQGALHILVNNAWGSYEYFNNGTEFQKEKGLWTVPLSRWDSCFIAGVRAH